MNLTIKQLRAFMTLREHRNFTRAAQASHLSQSAFSELIQSLESEAGVRLFDRNTRRVDLSAEGEVFVASAQHLLQAFEATETALRDRVSRRKGRVAVAALPSLAAGILPGVLAGFREAYPGIDIELFDVLSDACSDYVRTGRADFALAALADDMSELDATPFCADGFHLVCRHDHPLANANDGQPAKRLKLRDLLPYPFIHLARNTSIRQHLEAGLHPLKLRAVMEVEHLATAAALVEQGLGITVIPTLALFQFRSPMLAVVPLPQPRLLRQLYVIQPRHRSLSLAAQSLFERLMAARDAMP